MLAHVDVSSGFTRVFCSLWADYLMAEKVRDWNGLAWDWRRNNPRLREKKSTCNTNAVSCKRWALTELTFASLPSTLSYQWTNIAFMAVCRVINGAATSRTCALSFLTSCWTWLSSPGTLIRNPELLMISLWSYGEFGSYSQLYSGRPNHHYFYGRYGVTVLQDGLPFPLTRPATW